MTEKQRPRGRVWLVGAGPGDPDLITVRGAAVLREADAVVYDSLASPELLQLAPTEAERFNVGKRGHEEITRSQDDINALLVRLAREGKQVVRLKGGDPFVFGRGGEEATACVEAGVAFEVIPFITAAAGFEAAHPPSSSCPTIDSRFRMPIRITSVSEAVASSRQRVSCDTRVGSLWPVTTANEAECRRSVIGIPA